MNRARVRGWGRRYALRCLGAAMALLVAVMLVNLTVDPRGVFDLGSLDGVTASKVRRTGSRVEKSLRLWLHAYDTVFLGTSRVEVGLDPKSPSLNGVAAYNAGLSGSNMAEIARVGRFLLDVRPPKRLVIGLDFFMFTSRRRYSADFGLSGFTGRPMPFVLAADLASITTLEDSAFTIARNLGGREATVRDDGLVTAAGATADEPDAGRRFPKHLVEMYLLNTMTYACFDYSRSRLNMLHDLLIAARRAGVDVRVFMAPEHAWQIEAVRAIGLMPEFLRWRTDLLARIDKVNQATPDMAPVILWDFGGYSTVTTEDVPEPGSGGVPAGYADASHYSTATGDMVLARVLGAEGAAAPADFGEPLTAANVGERNAAIAAGHAMYRRDRTDEVAIVEDLVADTADRRARLCKAVAE